MPRRRALALLALVAVVLVVVVLGVAGFLWRTPSSVTDGVAAVPTGQAHAPFAVPTTTTASAGAGSGSAGAVRDSASAGSTASAAASGGGATGTPPALPVAATGQSARIEETGSITLLVPGSQIQPDLSRLTALAVANGGFVANSATQSSTSGSPAQGALTLSVPVASFASVLSEVQGLGRVDGLTTKATDVTGQYVDLQARIAALQSSRQQYLTIMTRASSIGDVLAVQQQLDTLQSQIEQLQGQLQVLDSETTYSTLTVTLLQKAVVASAPGPASGLTSAWHAATSGFVSGFEGLVRISGPMLFALLLLAAIVLAVRVAWRQSTAWRSIARYDSGGSGGVKP
ncbi:MAG: DUF4349 domain-containing protein [Acidimicrobiales bacterium]